MSSRHTLNRGTILDQTVYKQAIDNANDQLNVCKLMQNIIPSTLIYLFPYRGILFGYHDTFIYVVLKCAFTRAKNIWLKIFNTNFKHKNVILQLVI